MNRIYLVEDHDETWKVWREKKIKNLDLVHIDAHIDFAFPQIKTPPQIIEEAKSIKDLKSQLEKVILFEKLKFEKEKLTNIGNYIYPAMRDGIVKDFYWVIPGDKKEFHRSLKNIKSTLKALLQQDPKPASALNFKGGLIQSQLYGKKLFVSCLEALPEIREKVLLDIDIDFLIVNSIRKSSNTDEIGKRRIWIESQEFIESIKAKIKNPVFITVAYSVNGGYTPLKFKYLGDEITAGLKGKTFKKSLASINFELFNLYWQKKDLSKARYYYEQAISADSTYRALDNNYGPLYFAKKRYKDAQEEFNKILFVDPSNKDALCGMGEINLARRKYKLAERHFKQALKVSNDYPKAIFGLGRAKFRLREYKQAEKLLFQYQAGEPMQPHTHYLLGQVYQKEKRFHKAITEYKDALKLGLNSPELYIKLLRLAKYSAQPKEMIENIEIKFKEFEKDFFERQKPSLKKRGKVSEIKRLERKVSLVTKWLQTHI